MRKFLKVLMLVLLSGMIMHIGVLADNVNDIRVITSQDWYDEFLLIDKGELFMVDSSTGIKTKVSDNVIDAKLGVNMNVVFLTDDNTAKMYNRETREIKTVFDDVKQIYTPEGYGFGWPPYTYYAIKNDLSFWTWGDEKQPQKLIDNAKIFKSFADGYPTSNKGNFVITNDGKALEIEQYSDDGYILELKELCVNTTDIFRVLFGTISLFQSEKDNGEMTYYLLNNGELWGDGFNEKNQQNKVEFKTPDGNTGYEITYVPVRTDYELQKIADNVSKINGKYFWDNSGTLYALNYCDVELVPENTELDIYSEQSFNNRISVNANDEVFVIDSMNTKRYLFDEKDAKSKIILTIGQNNAVVFGEVIYNDVAPQIVNDRTMLPARFVAENLGGTVLWSENEPDKISIQKADKDIVIYIGKETAYVNGQEIKLDSPAFIENDRTYLPVRFISENLGAEVEWLNESQQVIISADLN